MRKWWLAFARWWSLIMNGPSGWALIWISLLAFFVPYAMPDESIEAFGSYAALSAIPVVIAAVLRGMPGSLIASAAIAGGLAVFNTKEFGLPWPDEQVKAWMFGNVGILIFGVTAGLFRQMARALARANRQLAEAHATIQHQALTDSLTNLPNHRALMADLERELDRARRFGRALTVVFFDGDHFKRINDTYGHPVGDAVLRELGERMQGIMRGGDVLGRYGGEEFVAILPEIDAAQARLIAERMRAKIAAQPMASGLVPGGVNVTISLGFACFPTDGASGDVLLTKADQAMYCAKRLGRNQARPVADLQRLNEMLLAEGVDDRFGSVIHTTDPRADQAAMIYSLMGLLELRDAGACAQAYAVSDLATALARELRLPEDQVHTIAAAGLLHDIGKIGIPDTLLLKAGKLAPAEWDIMRQHAETAATVLEGSPGLREVIPAVRHHHERWDGEGYPASLAGEAIPLAARILAVADAFVAMNSERPYRAARTTTDALAELERLSGAQFDPTVIAAALVVLPRQEGETARRELMKRQLAA